MPYEIQATEAYCVDASWFYCLAVGLDDRDDDRFEADINNTQIEDWEGAITHLLGPHLAKLGFKADDWSVFQVTDEYINYEGFSLGFYDYQINFETEGIARIDTTGLPASKTIRFTQPAQRLAGMLGLDEFEPIPLIWFERQERAGEEETEE
jgi:hypothetical protein